MFICSLNDLSSVADDDTVHGLFSRLEVLSITVYVLACYMEIAIGSDINHRRLQICGLPYGHTSHTSHFHYILDTPMEEQLHHNGHI